MSQREETTPDLPDPLRLLRSPQPTEFATPDAERGYNQEEDQYEPEQTFSHEDYGTTLLGADGDKRENFWRGMGMLDAKYKWVSEFLSRLVVWTICIDIASIGVLGYHYLGVAGGAGSCPKDKSLAVWLVIGMLGSIPATMVVQKVKDLYGSFRLAFTAEMMLTLASICWFCTGIVLTFQVPDGACHNALWIACMLISGLHAVLFLCAVMLILMTTLVPALGKLWMQVASKMGRA
mmetsp:Transcript_12576/g.30606  ORF Transcript_12576/g.30606 Transcript_12576/m.30606 type:complete len:235 (+) Transcript_12576:177-881(+)|eukprot:CAMPEP_0178990916 /NCGR_PEP_ID=MMETSP0795-20121207/5230_1 /TAXON_ID=88552 /ORGANISM="Amoebophrya sp., Strain Ameob2" /LENGTH=234 /DNA_ID=CAMNT_0020682551 /DNA_START=149 /DNA_END=853 /DNA_ORIENTATION=-